MKSLQRIYRTALGATLMLSGLCAAQDPPIYPIAELSDADVATIAFDGDLADWQSLGVPLIIGGDLISDPNVGDGAPYNAADLDYNIWLGWHPASGRIYAAVERIDDVYINDYPGGDLGELWRYDSIEFRIDGDHSGGDYSGSVDPNWTDDEQLLNDNRTAQQYGAIADAPDGRHIGYQGAGDWPNLPPYADAGGASAGSGPTISVAEFYVTPFDNLIWYDADESAPSHLYPDKIIGFDITLPDFDTEPGTYHAYHTLSGQASTWRYADRFADARLISVDPPPPGPPPPRLRVNYPDGGEEIGGNGWSNIHWFAENPIAAVRVEFSTDAGANWEEIVASTPNDGQLEWWVPEQFSSTTLIRVADAADGDPADVSNGSFSIVELLPKPVFDLPKFVRPPNLDGVREPEEWAGALELETSVSQVLLDGEEFGWRDIGAQYSEISANQLQQSDGEDAAVARPDADLSATIWHAWDDEAFYYIAEVRDNSHDVDSGPGQEPNYWWTRDGLSLYVDLGNSREEGICCRAPYDALNIVNFTADQQDASAETITWERIIDGNRNPTQDPDLIDGMEYGYRFAGDEFGGQADYVIEGRIPWSVLQQFNLDRQPVENTRFGFSWILLDPDGNDGYGGQLQSWGWAPDPGAYSTWRFTSHPAGILTGIQSAWLYRVAVFPDEPVNIYADVRGENIALVRADLHLEGEISLLASIDLLDDGLPPDAEAGDEIYTGQWPGSAQLGPYKFDLLAEDDQAQQTAWPDPLSFEIGHTIISVPEKMLVSPDGLETVRVPIFIEDSGSGYLTSLDFLSTQFDIHLDGNGLEPVNPSISFIGTAQEGLDGILDNSAIWDPDAEDWRLHSARASATSLDLFAATGPQEIFAFIDLEVDPLGPGELNVDIEHIMFDEESNVGIAKACCGNLQMGRGDVDDSRTIDAFDASLILMHTVRKVNIEAPDDPSNDQVETDYGFTFPAASGQMAEVSGEMGITAFDASLVLRREVGLIDYFPSEEGAYRLWDPPTGWWQPPTEPPTAKPVATARPMDKTIALDPVEKREDGLIAVPVIIDDMEGLLAGSFGLRFDPNRLRPAGVEATALTENHLFADHAQGSTVRVGFAGVDSKPGSGALAELLFQPLDATGTIGALELIEAQLNESDIDVRIAASPLSTPSAVPRAFALYPNYPNPFNPSTAIRYDLATAGPVRLSVYDLVGQRIRQLLDDHRSAGHHQLEWNGADENGIVVASGVYLLRLETDRGVLVRKMSMIK